MTTQSIIIREARDALQAAEERLEYTRDLLRELAELRELEELRAEPHDDCGDPGCCPDNPVVICPRHVDAITPNVLEGYDTILGYLAKNHPDILDTFDYRVPEATQRDGFKLSHMARIVGEDQRYVDAPRCLWTEGITRVRAY